LQQRLSATAVSLLQACSSSRHQFAVTAVSNSYKLAATAISLQKQRSVCNSIYILDCSSYWLVPTAISKLAGLAAGLQQQLSA